MRCLRYGAKGEAGSRTARKLIDEHRNDLYNAGKGGGIMAKKHTFMCPECKTRYECIGAMLKHRCEKCGAELVAEEVPAQQIGEDHMWAIAMQAVGWIGVAGAAVYGAMTFGFLGLCIGLGAGLLAASSIMTVAEMAKDIRRIRYVIEKIEITERDE